MNTQSTRSYPGIHAVESAILDRLKRARSELDLTAIQRSILEGKIDPTIVHTALNRLRKRRLIARTFLITAQGVYDTHYRYGS